MSRIEIEVKHHLCPGCCMWSGIEETFIVLEQGMKYQKVFSL